LAFGSPLWQKAKAKKSLYQRSPNVMGMTIVLPSL